MVAGGASQLFSGSCPPRLIHRRFMASHSYPRFDPNRLGMIRSFRDDTNVCTHSKSSTTGALRLRNCLDRPEGVFRRSDDASRNTTRAVAPYSSSNSLIYGSELRLDDEARAAKLANSRGGSSLGSSNHSPEKKFVVAVDVDEVLGSFLSALNMFILEHYSANHSLSEFYVYEFFRIWKCSRTEADIRVHEFFKTMHFKRGIKPIPGARRVLHRLSSFCHLSIVTSRQNVIKEQTVEWIEEHYPRLFKEVHFGNHFALDGQSKPKSEICRSVGAGVLIDDNPRYAMECAEAGIRVLLFDYGDSYPWSKCPLASSHPLVTIVNSWDQVERSLLSISLSSSSLDPRKRE